MVVDYDSLPAASFVTVYLVRRSPTTADAEYLLLRRAPSEALPGIWQGVTGTIEDNEAAWQTALREVEEETGLHLTELYRVDHVEGFYHPRTDRIHFGAVFMAEVAGDSEVRLSEEHDAMVWRPFDHAREALHWPNQRETLIHIQKYYVASLPPPEAKIPRK